MAANQVVEAKASFIGNHKANQAKNSIDCLFNDRRNTLYIAK